jgi:hypothetical protein
MHTWGTMTCRSIIVKIDGQSVSIEEELIFNNILLYNIIHYNLLYCIWWHSKHEYTLHGHLYGIIISFCNPSDFYWSKIKSLFFQFDKTQITMSTIYFQWMQNPIFNLILDSGKEFTDVI